MASQRYRESHLVGNGISDMRLQSSVDLIKSTLDLAASIPMNPDINDASNWPSFDAILNAFKNVCILVKPDIHMEKQCYKALLLMSTESEVRKLTCIIFHTSIRLTKICLFSLRLI